MTADENPIPIEARRLVEAFFGAWTVQGTMVADGKASAISGAWRFVRAADGWGVVGELRTTIEGWGEIEETELAGYYADEGKVHLIGMNKYVVRDHAGDWIDEKTLKLVWRGRANGKDVEEEVNIDLSTPDVQRGVVIERWDGAVAITTELTLTRKKG